MTDENSPDPPNESEATRLASTHTLGAAAGPARSIGPYRLLQKIGEGGMGEVWQAEQTEPVRRLVALKVIKQGMDTKQVIARFEAERQALAMMDHPGIAKVYEAGETPRGLPYFAMEYVKGEPITTYCDRHRLGTPERLELFARVSEAVQHAHQRGVIHRDLKPSNVLVSIVGEKPQPKVIDFGVAKATAQRLTEKTMFTELGMLIGTPEYMSPEQAEMTGLDVDTRTDVYALGVMLYELLTGALPFESKELRQAGFEEIRRRIREVDPPKPSTKVRTLGERSTEAAKNRRTDPGKLVSRLKGDLDWIVMKALEKDRTRRYGTPNELAADLERHLKHEPVLAGPPSAGYRTRKFVRRHRFGVAAASLAVVGLAAFGVMMAFQARAIARERDRAERVSEFLVELFRVSDPSEARGNSITARDVLDRGSKSIDKELGKEPEVQAQLLHTMGRVFFNLGLYQIAESHLERASSIRRRVLGERHPLTLQSMNRLAQTFQRQFRLPEAEKLLFEVLAARRRVLGKENPDTLQTLSLIGGVYERAGRIAEAERINRELLETHRRILGANHPNTLWSLNNLGHNLFQEGKLPESERLLRQATEGFERLLGKDHPDTLWARKNLAQSIESQGRLAEADALLRDVLDTQLRVLGADHADPNFSKALLARVVAGQKRFGEAEVLFQEALENLRRVQGPQHGRTLTAMLSMAVAVYMRTDRYQEADQLLRDTYEAARQAQGGKGDPRAIGAAYNLGCLAALQGKRDEAIRWKEKAVEAGYSSGMTRDADVPALYHHPDCERLMAALPKDAGS